MHFNFNDSLNNSFENSFSQVYTDKSQINKLSFDKPLIDSMLCTLQSRTKEQHVYHTVKYKAAF